MENVATNYQGGILCQVHGSDTLGRAGLLAKQALLAFASRYLPASILIFGSVANMIAFLTWAYLRQAFFYQQNY